MRVLAAVLVFAAVLRAQEATERVDLRVLSLSPVTIDRGSVDGLRVGDAVLLYPRAGGTYRATVVDVRERSAVVEMEDPSFSPEPGTPGEARVPSSRFAPKPKPEPEPEPEPAPPQPPEEPEEGTPEHPPWENEDSEHTPDKPLLAEVRPLRPAERTPKLSGLAYAIAEFIDAGDNDYAHDSHLRIGTDLVYRNVLRRGGVLRFNAEFDYLTEQNDESGLDLLLRRLSYSWGGTRFSESRTEVGRFLQHGMPEFGWLDGVEWGRRRANGHRFGASLGFMPEPDDDFETGQDLQVAAYYEWVSDVDEQLVLRAGFQKTWHDFSADRDLLVAGFRYFPLEGWTASGTVWVDFYTGRDDFKPSVEVTQAVATARRAWRTGHSLQITYTHFAYPLLQRDGEFREPANLLELADNHRDRLAIDAARRLDAHKLLRAHLSGFVDEENHGGAGEIGVEIEDLWREGARAQLTLFGTMAEYENVVGARVLYGRSGPVGRWDVLYEIANHHEFGFEDDRDDVIQHRLRLSLGRRIAGDWDVAVHGEVLWWDELSWAVGFSINKRF